METIKIDIVSDVACPWCYVGKRRLEAALEQWKGAPIAIEWHPYQLDPTINEAGVDRDTYLVDKFGSIEKTRGMTQHLEQVGKEVGINFNFGNDWLAVNTLKLHQLLKVAGDEGFKDQLKERFLKAYFEEALHLNKTAVLYDILAPFGWDRTKVDAIVKDDGIALAVRQEMEQYQKLGVQGVPFFIVNNKYGISGAQPPEVFLRAFAQVAPIEIITAGDSCDPDTGTC